MYYHENLPLAEIAIGFGLTEYQAGQLRAKTLVTQRSLLAFLLDE